MTIVSDSVNNLSASTKLKKMSCLCAMIDKILEFLRSHNNSHKIDRTQMWYVLADDMSITTVILYTYDNIHIEYIECSAVCNYIFSIKHFAKVVQC